MNRKFSRSLDELKHIVAMTDEFFKQHAINADRRYLVDLCLEELFVNMVTYNTETDEDILIELALEDKGIKARLTDYNVDRFDPSEIKSIDVDAPLNERSAGGLGLFLVMKMVDAIHYEYADRTSRVSFVIGTGNV